MEIFTLRARAAIQIAVTEFGTEIEKETWDGWATANPQVREQASDPLDDEKGSIPRELRETILMCLRKRYEHLHQQGRSPYNTLDDFIEISNKMSHLYSIARRFNPILQEWPVSV